MLKVITVDDVSEENEAPNAIRQNTWVYDTP